MKRGISDAGKIAPKRPFVVGLVDAVNDTQRHVYSDGEMVIIKDAYPKALHHYLVLPKCNISSLSSLKPDHVQLMKHMLTRGKEYIKENGCGEKTGVKFRYGFHSIPSMSRLHLHIISQDFDSPCLKTKKHWNSFTSKFFLDAEDVISDLEANGKVTVDQSQCEAYIKQDLKCHICGGGQKNMPVLKNHIRACALKQ